MEPAPQVLPLTPRSVFATQGRPLLANDDTPIRLRDWHNTRYHTNGYMTKARLRALLKENAFNIKERVGAHTTRNLNDYQVIPSLLEAYCRAETPNLETWTAPTAHAHGKAKRPLAGAAKINHERRLERERAEREERRLSPTDGKEKATETEEHHPAVSGGRQAGAPSESLEAKKPARQHQLSDAQVRNLRKRYAAASSTEAREAEIKRQAKRLHFTEKAVKEAATGRTHRHIPMPPTQAAETAAPA
jgi:hypothetical protein